MIEDLHLLQLSDSFFPAGMYSVSNGLESMLLEKRVLTARDLQEFILSQMRWQAGPGDCAAMRRAHKLAADNDIDGIVELDELLFAMRGVKESREASQRAGTQTLRAVAAMTGMQIPLLDVHPRCTFPVAFGVCTSMLGIPAHKAALSMLYGFVVSTTGAALRLGIIDHFDGQRVIHDIKPAIISASRNSGEPWQFAPQTEIYQMRHADGAKMFIT